MDTKVIAKVSLAVILCFSVALTSALECYECDRVSIANYNGADQTDVDAALDHMLTLGQVTNKAQCKSGSLTDDEKQTCHDGEVCYVLVSTFDMDYVTDAGTTKISAEGEVRYCLTSTERLPDIEYGCEDESHAEFTSAADNILTLLTSGSTLTNSDNLDGQLCKCTVDLCNGDPADAAENRSGDDSGAGIPRVYMAEVLFVAIILKWLM